MRAPLLALLGLIVAASPALAARSSDRGQAVQTRAKVSAPSVPSTQRATPPRASSPRATVVTRAAAPARTAAPTSASRRPAILVRGARAATPARNRAAAARTGRSTYAAAAPSACRGNVRHCRLVRVSAPQPMRWSQGLSPALNVQTSNCPAGTMATYATGHANVVRCMPI